MTKPKLLITGFIPEHALETLAQDFELTYATDTPFTRETLLAKLPEQDAIILLGYQADREFIDAGKHLKIIATSSVGFDHIDIDYAAEKGIVVANTPESVRIPTAEMALALMLDVTRRVPLYNAHMHKNDWMPMDQLDNLGTSVQGKTLGIFGMGRIGKTMAEFGQMLGMQVLYHNRHQLDASAEKAANVHFVSFDELVAQSDVLSLHAPATPETTDIINADVFKRMKPTAYLINVARGALVNEPDLVAALKSGEIAGAGLDVFKNEPGVPADFAGLTNLVMTPHAGTATLEARVAIFNEAVANVRATLFNGQPTNMVNHVQKFE